MEGYCFRCGKKIDIYEVYTLTLDNLQKVGVCRDCYSKRGWANRLQD